MSQHVILHSALEAVYYTVWALITLYVIVSVIGALVILNTVIENPTYTFRRRDVYAMALWFMLGAPLVIFAWGIASAIVL